jgi:hypothetical protein
MQIMKLHIIKCSPLRFTPFLGPSFFPATRFSNIGCNIYKHAAYFVVRVVINLCQISKMEDRHCRLWLVNILADIILVKKLSSQ